MKICMSCELFRFELAPTKPTASVCFITRSASAGVLIGLSLSGVTYSVIYGVVGRTFPAEKRSQAMGYIAAAGSFGQFVFSPLAYVLMSVLLFLHTIGGHYTFERVPFGFVTELFGFHRNHFDRLAHFSVGFYAYAIAEALEKTNAVRSRVVLFLFPIFAIGFVAMGYELIEWWYAELAGGSSGAAFLGSQGDIWDAQKDMLADTLGAVSATLLYFVRGVRG
mgnify:CR=1 FL=1